MAWNQIVKYQIFKLSTVTQWQRKNQTFAFPLGRRHMATPRLWRSQNWHKTWRIHPKVLSNERMKGVTDYFNPWFHFTPTYISLHVWSNKFSFLKSSIQNCNLIMRGYCVNLSQSEEQNYATFLLKIGIWRKEKTKRLQWILGLFEYFKVHTFWEGQKRLRNLHFTFDWHYIGQK